MEVPSADTYQPNYGVGKEAAAKWGFGSEARDGSPGKSRNISPGPGTYEAASRLGEGPKYGAGERLSPNKDKMNTPAPGSY